MRGTIRARAKRGTLEPVERVDLPEGTEVAITIVRVSAENPGDPFERAAGGWKDVIDAEELIQNMYEDHRILTRLEPHR